MISRFGILAFGMIAIVGIVWVHGRIANHQLATAALNTELKLAAQTTVGELRERTTQLLGDNARVLEKNLHWQLTHAIKQTINQTMAGLGQTLILDRQCQTIFGNNIWSTCRAARQASSTNYRSPHLIYSQIFADGQYLIITAVAIGSRWYNQHQRLQTMMSRLPAVKLVTGQAGLDNLKFVYHQPYLNYFYRHAERYQRIIVYALSALVALWLVWLLITLITVRNNLVTNNADLAQLVHWSEQFSNSNDEMATDAGRKIVSNMVGKLQTQMDQLRGLRQQLTVKNFLLADFSRDNQRLRDLLANNTLHKSVLSQASALNSHLLRSYDDIGNNASDLRATIFAIYRSYLQPLTTLAEHWQGQLCRRQLHRYLGVYHDNEQEKFIFRLQNDFQQMCQLSIKVHDGLTNILTFSRTLSTISRNLVPVMSLWEKVLLPHQQPRLIDLQPVLQQAQTLIKSVHPQQEIVFDNHSLDKQLQANAELLTCAVYHLYQTFFVDHHDRYPLKLTTTLDRQDRQLIIDIYGNRRLHNSDHRQFHLEQGQFILQKYNIGVSLSGTAASQVYCQK